MAKIYYRKITRGDTNEATGKAWVIEDVPARWRKEVKALLESSMQNEQY